MKLKVLTGLAILGLVAFSCKTGTSDDATDMQDSASVEQTMDTTAVDTLSTTTQDTIAEDAVAPTDQTAKKETLATPTEKSEEPKKVEGAEKKGGVEKKPTLEFNKPKEVEQAKQKGTVKKNTTLQDAFGK